MKYVFDNFESKVIIVVACSWHKRKVRFKGPDSPSSIITFFSTSIVFFIGKVPSRD